jgi:hypothetical protein
MPVTRKPVARPSTARTEAGADEAAIRAVIERGGTVAGEGGRADEAVRKLLQLRLPTTLISRIDGVRRTRVVPPSRHHWILEAIHEKLLREGKDADE